MWPERPKKAKPPKCHEASSRRRRRILRNRAARGLPLGESAVEDEQVLGREAVVVEVEVEVGREVGRALVVEDQLLPRAHAPRLDHAFHLGGGNLAPAVGELVDVHRARNVPGRVQLRGRGIDHEHVLALLVLLQPLDAHQRAAAGGDRRLHEVQGGGGERHQPMIETVPHVRLPQGLSRLKVASSQGEKQPIATNHGGRGASHGPGGRVAGRNRPRVDPGQHPPAPAE